jgi:hypothetical protein
VSVHYKRGMNDAFHVYAGNGLADIALQKAADAGVTTVRFPVEWAVVEPDAAGQNNHWAGTGPHVMSDNYDFNLLAQKAQQRGMKLLPIVVGVAPWILPQNRAYCHPEWIGLPNVDIRTYPLQGAWSDFADFVTRVIQFFKNCGVIEAVEIWNEPNLYGNALYIPNASHFSGMLATTITRVNNAHPDITVVSGGLYMKRDTPSSWQSYLDAFVKQSGGYALGIHPYDVRGFSTQNHNDYEALADSVATTILGAYDDIANYALQVHGVSRNIWVTETGAHSRNPLQEDGQKRVIRQILGHGVGFDNKPQCAAVFPYRMYPFDADDHEPSTLSNTSDGTEGSNTTFSQFSLLNADWSNKQAFNQLVTEWS